MLCGDCLAGENAGQRCLLMGCQRFTAPAERIRRRCGQNCRKIPQMARFLKLTQKLLSCVRTTRFIAEKASQPVSISQVAHEKPFQQVLRDPLQIRIAFLAGGVGSDLKDAGGYCYFADHGCLLFLVSSAPLTSVHPDLPQRIRRARL